MQIPARRGDDLYALYADYESDHTRPFTMLIGCEAEAFGPLPAGLQARVVPAGRYAVFDASGPQPASLVAVWTRIWELPLSRTYAGDFDHYKNATTVEVNVAIR